MYHYAGNNPIKYTDPDGNQTCPNFFSGFDNPASEFWGLLSNFSSGSDKISAKAVAAINGNESAKTQLNNLSPYMNEVMSNVANSMVITGMEYTRDYGGIVAVAAYASGNVVLGLAVDGITLACDITLAVNEYNNSRKTDADFNKMVSSVTVSSISTAIGMYTGDLVGKELKSACSSGILATQISNAVGDVMANFAATAYKVVDNYEK